jgi:hypothetical protein
VVCGERGVERLDSLPHVLFSKLPFTEKFIFAYATPLTFQFKTIQYLYTMKKRLTAEEVLELSILNTKFTDMVGMEPDEMAMQPFDTDRHNELVYRKLSCDFSDTPMALIDYN